MATQVQNRRGTTAEHSTFTGANGELTVDTTKRTLVVHDGATAGGRPLLREDQSNLPTSAPTTGVYNASGSLAISTNGTKRIEIQADGDIDIDNGGVFYDATNNRLAIGTTSPQELLHVNTGSSGGQVLRLSTNGADTGYLYQNSGAVVLGAYSTRILGFETNGTERARLDSSGRLLVGTSSARSNFYNSSSYSPRLQLESANSGANSSIALISVSGGGFDEPNLVFAKSRGSAIGDNTIVVDGDDIGVISFQASDGSEFVVAANILAEVDGTPAANVMPGRLTFFTTAAGASSPTERMRIKSTGVINFANAPTYADNTTAKAGGLVAGDVYKKADGTLMITF